MNGRVLGWTMVVLGAAALLGAQQDGASIDAPAGARPILEVRGDGVQIYACAQTAQGLKWVFKAPEAKLLDGSGNVVGSHFAGPSWKFMDGGGVQGELIASRPSPDAGSVAWLLLRAKAGTAAGSFSKVAFIRRSQTHGGAAGSAGCQGESDLGKLDRVPYTATYTFYSAR
jgi:hypothetical protein